MEMEREREQSGSEMVSGCEDGDDGKVGLTF